MTRQEIFTKVYKHLMKQRKQAQDSKGFCQYRNSSGLKCAIGCLIPDELYNKEWDKRGDTAYTILLKCKELNELLDGSKNSDMLGNLQSVHDDNNVDLWENELEKVAKTYHLEIPA